MRKLLLLLLAAVLFGGCASYPLTSEKAVTPSLTLTTESIKAQRETLIGKWFINQRTTDGGINQEIAEMKRDGTFVFHFRDIDANGNDRRSVEVGEWGIVGEVHFTITKTGLDKYYDVYKVVKLTDKEFTYQHAVTNNEFTSRKVSDDFRFSE